MLILVLFLFPDAEFVYALDYGPYIYFFFREVALEKQNCQYDIISRVARICKVTNISAVYCKQLLDRVGTVVNFCPGAGYQE